MYKAVIIIIILLLFTKRNNAGIAFHSSHLWTVNSELPVVQVSANYLSYRWVRTTCHTGECVIPVIQVSANYLSHRWVRTTCHTGECELPVTQVSANYLSYRWVLSHGATHVNVSREHSRRQITSTQSLRGWLPVLSVHNIKKPTFSSFDTHSCYTYVSTAAISSVPRPGVDFIMAPLSS